MIEGKTGTQDGNPGPRGGAVLLRAGALICVLLLVVLGLRYLDQVQHQKAVNTSRAEIEEVPAYSRTPPTKPLPATIPADQFDDPDTHQAYLAASRIKFVLYQLPCYCNCDRTKGHKNLLDCFRSYHGAGCLTCQREAIFAYRQFQIGKTVAEIRQAIIHGDWRIRSK